MKMDKLRRTHHGANFVDEFEFGPNSDAIFIIDSRSLRVISRSLFLAAVLLALPSIGSIIGAATYAPPLHDADADSEASNWINNLPLVLHDLMEDGLITKGHKGFVLGEVDSSFLRDAGVYLAAGADLRRNRAEVFDYICAASFSGIEKVTSVMRDGGLAIAPLGGDLSAELRLLRSFKIVYLRRLNDETVVAMRKTAAAAEKSGVRREALCGIAPHEKKESALRGLEDVYLEAPKIAKKSRFRFLPDLMKDPLDEYGRRVFIADDSKAMDWFYNNYPMRGQEFQVYKEMEGNWIEKTGVRAEDYVVIKAEARVVEQMMRDKTLCVVDELFLECREDEEWEGGERRRRKRAYWECVALYGKIRDEGIAVHQWWY